MANRGQGACSGRDPRMWAQKNFGGGRNYRSLQGGHGGRIPLGQLGALCIFLASGGAVLCWGGDGRLLWCYPYDGCSICSRACLWILQFLVFPALDFILWLPPSLLAIEDWFWIPFVTIWGWQLSFALVSNSDKVRSVGGFRKHCSAALPISMVAIRERSVVSRLSRH